MRGIHEQAVRRGSLAAKAGPDGGKEAGRFGGDKYSVLRLDQASDVGSPAPILVDESRPGQRRLVMARSGPDEGHDRDTPAAGMGEQPPE